MLNFAKILDGSGKAPRAEQLEYFDRLARGISQGIKVFGMSGPPGIGKSYIARTIQRTCPGTAIVTTNNILVDQYTGSYPELVGVKGKDYYDSVTDYYKARKAAKAAPAVFNPLSYYYFYTANPKLPRPGIVVIDEAHKLADMLLLTVGRSYPCQFYGIPADLTEEELLVWLKNSTERMAGIMALATPTQRQAALIARCESLYLLYDYIRENRESVHLVYEQRPNHKGVSQLHLTVRPIEFPHGLMKTIFPGATVILLSGSLTTFDMDQLYPNQKHDFVNFEPLAPKENRPIYSTPLPFAQRKSHDAWAKQIKLDFESSDRPNTLIHVSYGDALELGPRLRSLGLPVITHTKDDKTAALERFKRDGGILVAAGMAEGIDLPGDLCRLIIIPRILFPNRGDLAVIKRLALPRGEEWYQVNTVMTTVQQIGRGVRGKDDKCVTRVYDPMFKKLVRETEKYLTKGFKESILW